MAYPFAVYTPVHASWLNQVEICFSIVQRKVLTPNDFNSLTRLRDRRLRFEEYYEKVAQPFQRKFTRRDLERAHGQAVRLRGERPLGSLRAPEYVTELSGRST